MILFCDFDGTLFRRNLEGDFERNLEAIRRWREAGHKFVMTTGRSPASLGSVLPNYASIFDYTVGDNGAVCLGPNGVEFEISIPSDEQYEITDFVRSLPRSDEFDFVYDRGCHGHSDIDGGATKIRVWTVDRETMESTLARCKERFGDKYLLIGMGQARPCLPFIHEGHSAAINFMAAEAGKEKALLRVARLINEPLYAVGDGNNDMAMLRMFDGYIMNTASEVLRAEFSDDKIIDSVAELIDRLLVLEDIYKQIGVDLSRKELCFYKDGATQSKVFSADQKYLVKITSHSTVRTQREFLSRIAHPAFQNLLCWDDELHYECYEFVVGRHYKEAPLEPIEAIRQLVGIVAAYPEYRHDGYGFLENEKASWYDFLLDEIEYAQLRIPDISQDNVLRALRIAGAKNPKKYLMHGDFGTHNFLISNKMIRVIDPMPMVGDRLYDFYFAVFSNVNIFDSVSLEYCLSFFGEHEREYREALMVIVLYVRASRAAVYDKENLNKYLTLYQEWKWA